MLDTRPHHPLYVADRGARHILIGDTVKHDTDDGTELAAVTGVLAPDDVRIRYVVGDADRLGEFEPYVRAADLIFIERPGDPA